jgi:hypothetical protein
LSRCSERDAGRSVESQAWPSTSQVARLPKRPEQDCEGSMCSRNWVTGIYGMAADVSYTLWTSKVPMTAVCPTRFLFFSPFCVAKQAFTTCVQWGSALSSPCRWRRCQLPAGLRPRCAGQMAQLCTVRWRCPAQATRSLISGLQWSRQGSRCPTRRLWPEHCMMTLHGCSTAAPATSFAFLCVEPLARQRAGTARATRSDRGERSPLHCGGAW